MQEAYTVNFRLDHAEPQSSADFAERSDAIRFAHIIAAEISCGCCLPCIRSDVGQANFSLDGELETGALP